MSRTPQKAFADHANRLGTGALLADPPAADRPPTPQSAG